MRWSSSSVEQVPDKTELRVGLVGSGPVLSSIAQRVAAAFGCAIVCDPSAGSRNAKPVSAVVTSPSLRDLRARADVVVTLLQDEETLRTFLLSEAGLTQASDRTLTLLDLSPVQPTTLQELAESCRAAKVVVFGGSIVPAWRDGRPRQILYVDRGALAAAPLSTVLSALAEDIVPIGEEGNAKAIGLLTDLLMGVNSVIVREALLIGRYAGIDSSTLARLVLKGSGATAVMARIANAGDVDFKMQEGNGLRNGLERALAVTQRVDHSLFFGSLAIAQLLAQPWFEPPPPAPPAGIPSPA